MTSFDLNDVFVTGGEPTVTYVGRPEQGLEDDVRRYLDTGNQVLAVSGPSKSGKSTLVNRILRETDTPAVRITGTSLESVNDFWQVVAHRLAVPNRVEHTKELTVEAGAQIGGKVGGGVIPSELSGQFQSRLADRGATLSSPTIVLSESVRDALVDMNICLVIDDFHYATEPVRTRLAREIKDLVFNGARVILVAIPQRVMDVLQSEAELVGRVSRLVVKDWSQSELLGIATLGFDALNVHDPSRGGLVGQLVPQSYGSPLLMQALCRKLCEENSVFRTVPGEGATLQAADWESFYGEVAMSMQPRLVEHLNMGPVERRRRTQRPIQGGGTVDLYSALLMALRLRSPQRRLTSGEISDAMTEFMDRPTLEQVRRTCRQMADIAMKNRGDGDVALDWSTHPERLSVVDPYLAFFLAWGLPSLGLPNIRRRN